MMPPVLAGETFGRTRLCILPPAGLRPTRSVERGSGADYPPLSDRDGLQTGGNRKTGPSNAEVSCIRTVLVNGGHLVLAYIA